MRGLTFHSVSRGLVRYGGWALSLLDSVLRPFTEPVGLRPPATSRGHTRADILPGGSPARESELVSVPAPPGQSIGPVVAPMYEQGSPLFVGRPRRDSRRPGQISFRYTPYQPDWQRWEGAFLARRAGRKYVPIPTPVLSSGGHRNE